MIRSITVKNFLSIKSLVTFDFKANNKEKSLKDTHLVEVEKGVFLHKLGIIYGKNASGKSNFLEVFDFLKSFWFKVSDDKDEDIGVVPFLLDKDSRTKPSEFSIVFYKNKVKYKYFLSIFENNVIKETLDYYPTTQPANLFERRNEDGVSEIEFGPRIKVKKVVVDQINVKCLPNISFFAAYNQVNTRIPEIEETADWIRNNIMPPVPLGASLWKYTEKLIYKDEDCKKRTLNYLKEADFNISQIKTEEREENITDDMMEKIRSLDLPESRFNELQTERKFKIRNTQFEHAVIINEKEEQFPLPQEYQSDGTMRMFGLSGALFTAIKEKAFIAIDEIEAKLHPKLIKYVLSRFLKESKETQLLVSTHYDNLLDEEKIFRKDNFWFTDKNADGSTELYSIYAFGGLNRKSSLQKAYSDGEFKSIPNIDI